MSLFGIGAGAVLGAVSGLIGSKMKNDATKSANQASIAFEREKAQNAHQWEVEDLRKAGLNPILSAGGSGASIGSPTIIPAGESPLSGAINGAMSSQVVQEQLKQAKEKTKQEEINTNNLLSLSNYFEPDLDENGKQIYKDGLPQFHHRNLITDEYKNRVASTALQNSLIEQEIKSAKYDNVYKGLEASLYSSPYAPYLFGVERAIRMAGDIGKAVYSFR